MQVGSGASLIVQSSACLFILSFHLPLEGRSLIEHCDIIENSAEWGGHLEV